MARHVNQLLDRIDLLEARLDELERRFDSTAAPIPPQYRAGLNEPAPDFSAPRSIIAEEASDSRSAVGSREDAISQALARRAARYGNRAAFLSPSAADARVAPPTAPSRDLEMERSGEDRDNLERVIGGRWYAILGGLVVIIGVAFFYQYAVQQGWFRILPAWAKCAAGGLFGAALLAAAELIRRRINAWAAVGLSAAGVGTMYVSAFAAHARYGLVDWPTAFVLLTLCAGVGVVFAARARLVAVAVVSLVGGYLTPILLYNSGGSSSALPPYWLMLLTVGLVLAGRLRGPFVALRWLAYWGTLIFAGGWILARGDDSPILALITLTFTWCAVHAELWWSASRERREDDEAAETDELAGLLRPPAQWPAWGSVLSSFCVTAWTAGLGVIHARAWGQIPDWFPAAGAATGTGLAALILAGNLRVLRDPPGNAVERLGAGLAAQAGALLIAAVALALTGRLEVIAWIAMGVAAAFAARWMRSRAIGIYGVLLLSIATARLLTYDVLLGGMNKPFFINLGLAFSWWMLLIVAAATSWFIVARLIAGSRAGDGPASDSEPDSMSSAALPGVLSADEGDARRPVAITSGIGVGLLLLSCLHPEASEISVTIVWMGLAGILMACARLVPALRLEVHSAWTGLLALVAWSIAFVMPGWAQNSDAPGLHRGLIIAVVLAAELVILGRILAQRLNEADESARRYIRSTGVVLATILIFVATSFEVARVAGVLLTDRTGRLAAVSIWWGAFALALLAAGFLRKKTAGAELPRYAGLALLGIATAKALFMDTAQVSMGWRVISVLGLGLLMLGVGVAYARLSRSAAKVERAGTKGAGPSPALNS